MTTLSEFTALQSGASVQMDLEPLWKDCITPASNLHKEKFKSWFQKHLTAVENFNQYRIWNEWNNLLWYTGDILDYVLGYRILSDFSGFKDKARRTVPFWVSHVSDLIDKRANDLASLKPNFEILPPENDVREKTRMSARLLKPILKHIRVYNNLDMLFDTNERGNCAYGKSFLGIEWNPKRGDRKPEDKQKTPEWEGEVEIKEIFPWYVLSWPTRVAFTAPVAIQIYEILHKEEAKKKYGISETPVINQNELYGFASPFDAYILPNEIVIYRTVHIPNEYLPNGAVVYSLRDGTVVKSVTEKYPYSHNDFPWEMHTDITLLGKVFPYSVMNYLKPLQWTYNLLGGLIKKSIFLGAHPKWMMTRGACNIQSLGNAFTVVQHKLGQKPSLERYDVVGADTINFRENVKTEMRQLAGSHGISSGELPPNTRSGIQISRLQNLEKLQRSYQIGKRNDFMRRVLVKAGSVAGDYYPKTSPENLVRMLGNELAENIGILAETKVSSQESITIQNSSGFSDDLAGRLEEVAFSRKNLPGLMAPQQEADIIGLRNSQKFYDVATAALRMAEAENEAFNDSKPVDDPLEEQDHIVHWQQHVLDMQTPQHARLPEKLRKKKERHLGIHEMMMEQLSNNPAGMLFKQRLMTLERWPIVYKTNNDLAAIQAESQQQQVPQLPEPSAETEIALNPTGDAGVVEPTI